MKAINTTPIDWAAVKDELPHGSGIDCTWECNADLDDMGNHSGAVVFSNAYHGMDENGMYDGWLSFRVEFFQHKKDVSAAVREVSRDDTGRPGGAMKVSSEMFARWNKYCRLLLAENKMTVESVVSPVVAWNVAFKLDIPKEAYHVGMNDAHIETALRKIFPQAWKVQA